MNLEEIIRKLREGGLPPGDLAEMKSQLAGHYAFYAGQWEEILKRKAAQWIKLREFTKSDNSADRQYELTEDGKSEIIYRLKLKVIEKLMSGISTRIRVAEGESKSQW